MRQRGLSLLELLAAITVGAFATVAVSRVYQTGLDMEQRFGRTLDERQTRARFEERIRNLLEGAAVGSFVSPIAGDRSGESLAFTTWSVGLPAPLGTETAPDFDRVNERFGALGGLTEVGLSTNPVGADAGQRTGLFLRTQRPIDTDLTQGGNETLLDDRISDIRFEFYDGTNWQTSWDSDQTDKGKIPVLVRVTYLVADDEQPKTFEVRLPLGGGS